ncbi:MAG: phosphate signaling complex protein PhoU [Desulfobacteraceae bacterium]|jgi:phosphate transport system protein|nr:phosphate signaling complex protein PhoU [Desulfobacteraceae bacterium]
MPTKTHIVRSFDDELNQLKTRLAGMGQAAGIQLKYAVQALTTRDCRLASEVIDNDIRVNALQSEIDSLAVRLLAMRQPVAIDLRNIISGLKMAAEIERIADYAANIAKNVANLNQVSLENPLGLIIQMAGVAQQMLQNVVEAYGELDVDKALSVWHRDAAVNRMYADLLSQLRTIMSADIENLKTYTSLIFVARCCERIGDHIKNLAECVYYIQAGESFAEISRNRDRLKTG